MINPHYANMLYRLLRTNYDYYYLKSRLSFEGVILIVGSSYAVKGIDVSLFDLNTVNCSCSSQDLFYDREIILKSIQKKSIPRIVVIVLGYYDLFRDISLEKNMGLEVVKTVYYPLFHIVRNNEDLVKGYDLFENIDEIALSDEIRVKMEEEVTRILAERCNFFSDYELRRSVVFSYNNLPWRLCPEEQKRQKALERADKHNQFFVYKDSLTDNIQIVTNTCKLADDLGIRLFFVIPPFTKLYLSGLDKGMISVQTGHISNICSQYHNTKYFDFNLLYSDDFDDNDFLDMDHLNGRGAMKFSMLLNGIVMEK